MQQKTCSKCGSLKLLDSFSKRKQLCDGYRSQCKLCDKIDNDQYKKEHASRIKIQRAEYRRQNPDKTKGWRLVRRARIKNLPFEKVEIEYFWKVQRGYCQLCFNKIDRCLPNTDPMALVLDHVIPIAHKGPTLHQNLVLAHRICNARKGSKLDFEIINKRFVWLDEIMSDEVRDKYEEWLVNA